MLKSFRRLTQVRVYWEWIDSPPVGVHLPFFGQTKALALLARKKLPENIEKWNTVNIAIELARKGIRWRSNPPSAPDQGGI